MLNVLQQLCKVTPFPKLNLQFSEQKKTLYISFDIYWAEVQTTKFSPLFFICQLVNILFHEFWITICWTPGIQVGPMPTTLTRDSTGRFLSSKSPPTTCEARSGFTSMEKPGWLHKPMRRHSALHAGCKIESHVAGPSEEMTKYISIKFPSCAW